jgi:hypothetical protein
MSAMGLREKIVNKTNGFIIDKNFRLFEKYLQERWGSWKVKDPKSVVIIDVFLNSMYAPNCAYYANILAKNNGSKIVGFLSGRLLFDRAWKRIYSAFNVGELLMPLKYDLADFSVVRAAWVKIRTKKDLIDHEYKGIAIGIDIYESYLRLGNYTLNLDDPKLFSLYKNSFKLIDYWSRFFKDNAVSAVIVSHDCYLYCNALAKVAYLNKVPVYLPNYTYPTYSDRPFTFYSFVKDYHKVFSRLSEDQKEKGLEVGRRLLEKRIGVNKSVDCSCEINTFNSEYKKDRIIKESKRIKVLICSHCFYDSPNAYSQLFYEDFYEWLESIGRLSLEYEYDWYIKIHQEPMPGTMKVIDAYLKRYPSITLIPNDSNAHQLADEGLNFVITNHGSVGHEYPALGVHVVNTGFNPHIAYDFNWHASSREEVGHYIKNLHLLKKSININDMYEFYYMHYRLCMVSDLLFSEYRSFCEKLSPGEVSSSTAFGEYLKLISMDRDADIERLISGFVESGQHHFFSMRPELSEKF